MADAVLPARPVAQRAPESWLDRPFAPSWQRIAALTAHWELILYGAIVAVALVLRIWDVGARAMHHDESLHAYYSWKLATGQGYAYDPLMHGPLQFELVALFYVLFGDSEFSARLLAVILGTVLVFLPFYLRPYLGRTGALLASAMLAISPAFVYFSRFIRDDMYLACFTLILFIAIVRYLDTRRPVLLYVAAAAMACAMASMEAAYLTFFIFGTFIIVEALREYLAREDGPVLSAVKGTSLDTWLTSLSIFVVMTVLFYSTFFTNPYGIWDTQHALTSPYRKDILGGLLYWKLQHSVQRGGQPWFYYLLLLPLYEQLALLFGAIGLIYAAVKRSLATTFLAWWAVMAFGLYSWAGEKMPWLVIHIALPLILLAGLALNELFRTSRRWLFTAIALIFSVLLALEIHSTFVLNFVDGANPTEMLIYVQTAQDVPNVVKEVSALSHHLTGGTGLQIGLDDSDVGGWPFIWYLRHYPNITETSSFSGPVCNGQYCPVLLMLGPEYDQYSPQLMKHYVAQRYRWNWWFPEDYKQWFPQHWGNALTGSGSFVSNILGTPADWSHIWDWLIYRRPFGDRGARLLYVLVRRDLVPGAKYFSTRPIGSTTAPQVSLPQLSARMVQTMGATGVGPGALDGPRGMASDSRGDVYVADTLNHRVVEFGPSGTALREFGGPGAGPGQFSLRDSPQGLGVAPDGKVYVADTWNERIEVFSPEGRFIRQWGGGPIGSAPGQFFGPRSVAVSNTGRVYVADTGNRRIQVFTTTGRFLQQFGTGGTGPGRFQEPSSVAVAPDSTVYVSDFWNQRIQAFTPDGRLVRSWAVQDWTPQSYDEPYLAINQHTGNIFATDPGQQQVLEYTPSGSLLGAFGSSNLTVPIGVAVRADGSIAVSDATANHVSVFSPPAVSRTQKNSVTQRRVLREPTTKKP